MVTLRFLAHFACAAVLAAAASACSTQRTADDVAMRRAYENKVAVTGSRVLREVDPKTGRPNVGYPTFTLGSDGARAMLRSLSRPVDAQN